MGHRRDEVLHHELAHALSDLAGKSNSSIAPAGFGTKNEFWAVMVTNIYSSAWNRPLRKDHGSRASSPKEAEAFFAQYASMVDWMCRDQPAFTRAIAQIDWIPFNPLRESYRRRETLRVTSSQPIFR